jgi:hypothetical protein
MAHREMLVSTIRHSDIRALALNSDCKSAFRQSASQMEVRSSSPAQTYLVAIHRFCHRHNYIRRSALRSMLFANLGVSSLLSASPANHFLSFPGDLLTEVSASPVLSDFELLLENGRISADPLPFQTDIYLDTIGDLDEGNAPVYGVVFAIEDHSAVDAP